MKTGLLLKSLALGFVLFCLSFVGRPGQAHQNPPSLGPDDLSITFNLPEYTIITDSAGYNRIKLEGFGDDETPGRYLLPVQVRHLALPADILPGSIELLLSPAKAEILPGTYRFNLARQAAPDCGAGTTTCELSAAGAGMIQTRESAPLVRLASQGQIRKWQVIDLEFAPFTYDAASQTLSVTRQVEVQIRYRRDASRMDPMLLQDQVMDKDAADMLENATLAQGWYAAAAAQTAAAAALQRANLPTVPGDSTCAYSACDLVIITSKDIVNHSPNLNAFVISKENHGHHVWVVTEDTLDQYTGQAPNTRADRIRKFLQMNYINYGIRYVLLIGDPDPVDTNDKKDFIGDVPMKMTYPRLHATYSQDWLNAPTDSYYADMTGNWDLNGDLLYAAWLEDLQPGGVDTHADLYVGRIPSYQRPVRDYSALNSILLKLINYENVIWSWSPWHENNVLLPMSFSAPAYDGAPLGEELKADLQTYGYTNLWTMYQQGSSLCGPNSAYTSSQELVGGNVVRNRWKANDFGLIVWWGHGSWNDAAVGFHNESTNTDCWDGPILDVTQAKTLNDNHPAFVYMNSCLNGTPEVNINLGYSVLLNGAAATVAASRPSWFSTDQFGNFANGATNASIGFRYADNLARGLPAGMALASAKSGGSPTTMEKYSNMLVFNLYGDPSMAMTHGNYPLNTHPGWPGNLTMQASSTPHVYQAAWGDYTGGEAYFMLQQSPDSGGPFTTKEYFSANSIRGQVHLDYCGATFYYRIVAHNKFGDTADNPVALTFPPCQPERPTDVAASIVNSGVKVTWQDDGVDEDGYHIYRHNVVDNTWAQMGGDIPKNTLSYIDTTTTCETSYEYKVVAFNAGGESYSDPWPWMMTNYCPPHPPMDVHQTGVTESSISIAWTDASAHEVNFTVDRADSNTGPWTHLVALPENTVSYTDSNPPLTCGTTVYYRVEAMVKYGAGISDPSPAMTTLPCSPPAAPSNLAASTTKIFDPAHVYLTWDDNSPNEEGFKIERSIDGGSTWGLIGTTPANHNYYTDPGACSLAPRKYRVKAFNASDSGYSNVADAAIPNCNPYAPAAQAQAVTGSQVELTWTYTNPAGFTTLYFRVYYAGPPYMHNSWVLEADNIPVTTFSYIDSGLPCEKLAYYFVQAVAQSASGGTATFSSEKVSATPNPCAPSILGAVTLGQNFMLLQWEMHSVMQTGFLFEDGDPLIPRSWHVIAELPAASTQITLTNLTCATDFNYRMRSYIMNGPEILYSDYSEVIPVTTLGCTTAAPSNLAVTGVTQTSANLSWTDASTNEDGFRVWRAAAGEATFYPAGTAEANTGAFTDTTVLCGNDYDYFVTAYNNSGNSAASTIVRASTIPCTPTGLAAHGLGPDTALLQWDLSVGNSLTFTVQSSSDPRFSRGALVISNTVSAPATSLKMPVTACATPFFYRIFATNGSGLSPVSGIISLTNTCLPVIPTSLGASGIGAHRLTLHWQHPGTNITGYRVFLSFDGSADWRDIGQVGPGETTFTALDLPAGQRMYFRVVAFNDSGPSGYSSTLMVNTNKALYLPVIQR